MGKITDYPSVSSFDDGDVFLIDGTNGTRTVTAEDVVTAATERVLDDLTEG